MTEIKISQEQWDKIVIALAAIPAMAKKIDGMDVSIRGNGKPGLERRVEKLETLADKREGQLAWTTSRIISEIIRVGVIVGMILLVEKIPLVLWGG